MVKFWKITCLVPQVWKVVKTGPWKFKKMEISITVLVLFILSKNGPWNNFGKITKPTPQFSENYTIGPCDLLLNQTDPKLPKIQNPVQAHFLFLFSWPKINKPTTPFIKHGSNPLTFPHPPSTFPPPASSLPPATITTSPYHPQLCTLLLHLTPPHHSLHLKHLMLPLLTEILPNHLCKTTTPQ